MSLKVQEMIEKTIPTLQVQIELPVTKQETWQWLTQGDKTAQWIGPFNLNEDKGSLTMIHEEGQPAMDFEVLEKHSEESLSLGFPMGETGDWQILLILEEVSPKNTRLTLIQPWEDPDSQALVSAGWQFYGDCLFSAITGKPAPTWTMPTPEAESNELHT